jgi:hypothetical protein
MSTLNRTAAGFALFTALAAGCGSLAATHSGTAHSKPSSPPPAMAHPSPPAPSARTSPPAAQAPVMVPMQPQAPPAAPAPVMVPTHHAPPANPIPQGNGGDGDADNNGGPVDGDGGV